MEENFQSTILDGEITGIQFGLAAQKEICTASTSGCSISHSTQLTNPFLGLPLEYGKCESCGTSEPGECEGHFGYIELPIPIYHPSHVGELKRLLSLLCLKCLKLKNSKFQINSNGGVADRLLSCCEASQVSVREVKKTDGACFLQMKVPSKVRLREGFWGFMERYGFRYGDADTRTLLPSEAVEILKRIPAETKKRLARKGYFPQEGYILKYLPVPPNCLSIPDVSDGVRIMSSDLSIFMLKKVLKQVDIIKSSRSGSPNFEAHEVEANELQLAVDQYLQVRGTAKSSKDADVKFGVKQSSGASTKAWLEKMRTLFIRKGSGFSSRSVITGDTYKRVNEIGIPYEIAQRITFEERVNEYNMKYLQKLVDNKLCLTYKDGLSTYSLREGSKGHTFLRPGQVVHRRIMDGDTVFINRPPTTHKHSLQALSVYVHDDHTVKINPLICGPLSADFDGDCIHLFYPQSLAAKAEVMELFSVEKQLLSSHSGNLNLQLTTDALLSLKTMFKKFLLDKAAAQQLAMFASSALPEPPLLQSHHFCPQWTAPQMLQTAFPGHFDCYSDKYLIRDSNILEFELNRDIMKSLINEIVTSVHFEKGPQAVLTFFDSLQPLLMEHLFCEGYSVSLQDFSIARATLSNIQKNFKVISALLCNLRSAYNELVELQLESHIRLVKVSVADFILRSSAMGELIDSKSDSAITKVVQQVAFLGLQISDRGKFYSKTLVEDIASHFEGKYPSDVVDYPSAKHGLIQGCFFHGLDPYEEMVHSISSREVMVRSSRGLSEPGTLFKNLMAILRDVVICYDGTVRNVCSNSIIQFDYGLNTGRTSDSLFPAGEPVGVLAATAMSNPAYKAVLDSTSSSNSSWELMKEILLCKASFKNDHNDCRVILHLNDCGCGRNYCMERAAWLVKNHLERVSLKDIADCFMIEYKSQRTVANANLVGHIHLKKLKLQELNIDMQVVLRKCEATINSFQKKKKVASLIKRTTLSVSECCCFRQSCADESSEPCLMFSLCDTLDAHLEKIIQILAEIIYPVFLETIIKGNERISSANIIWVSPDTTAWIRNTSRTQKGELALDIVLEKSVVKQSGDAWRIVLDACLPVLHLIDTTRSVPYAIKQVEELLGVSCAFDQVVQRLSTSVAMVAKGVLKEHLILLANSMTCAGSLVGFNAGGYKALSRSLDIQVPFTEATLFTPRKCFERAAEKCHMDTLSSVVASCSWGKRVAVGTGSRFDLLWGGKESTLKQEESINVYNFLNMVRSIGNEDSVTASLGAEVDDLVIEDGIDDWCLSPEHQSGSDKPVFEDSSEFQNCSEDQHAELNWEKASPLKSVSNGGGNWDVDHRGGGNWDVDRRGGGNWDVDRRNDKEKSWSGWERNTSKKQSGLSSKAQDDSDQSSAWNTVAAWQSKTSQESSSKFSAWCGWDTMASPQTNADQTNSSNPWSVASPQTNADQTNSSNPWSVASPQTNADQTNSSNPWSAASSQTNADRTNSLNPWSDWEAQKSKPNDGESTWGTQRTGQQIGEFKKNRSEGSRGWGSSTGEWKSRNRPPKPPGMVADDSIISGLYTATRQRLDIFTSQEQDILSDVEPLMQSIRRIMHQPGYNDGDPLSADDQSFVLDKVFNHHPDKAVKMGVGIDHITVNKHSSFQESRCFHVVSTDGCRQDFSYRKCLENFIKGKYPDLAEEFIGKYFPRTRTGGNRQRNQPSEGTADESRQRN